MENRARWGFGPGTAPDRTVLWVEAGSHRVEIETAGPPKVDSLLASAVAQLVRKLDGASRP